MSKPFSESALRNPVALLCLIVLAALLLRAWAAVDYGRDWYGDGRITLVNFDEAGSCRAALGGFDYSPFVGWQTIALADGLGLSVPGDIYGEPERVKAWCQSDGHLLVARAYSAICGAMTVLALWCLCRLLVPDKPGVAPLAASFLAVSGWHISESMVGTVDAASSLFIYSFFAVALWARRSGGLRWVLAALALGAAIATKYWIFALLAGAALVPASVCALLIQGLSGKRSVVLLVAYAAIAGLVTNPALPAVGVWLLPLMLYLLPPWRKLSWLGSSVLLLAPWMLVLAAQSDVFTAFTGGGLEGRFGTDYGAIAWNKPLRNALNLPIVLVVGLGLPASLFTLLGLRSLWREGMVNRAWLWLLPVPAFALYLAFLTPVTYYRHYLPLLPAFCILAAVGLVSLDTRILRTLIPFLLAWQALLAWDLVSDYHMDPRRELPAWYTQHQPRAVLTTYYVNPPPRSSARHALLRQDMMPASSLILTQADTLILSENWYDTAFANEINGPLVNDLERLIKTTPTATHFYRRALAGEDPRLLRVAEFRAPTFMPELLLHRWAYGSFTQFVGDIVILRVSP